MASYLNVFMEVSVMAGPNRLGSGANGSIDPMVLTGDLVVEREHVMAEAEAVDIQVAAVVKIVRVKAAVVGPTTLVAIRIILQEYKPIMWRSSCRRGPIHL
jgi:hypothetical protein